VLGVIIGASEGDIARGLKEYWENELSMSPFFRRIDSGLLSVQIAMLLLRQCGVPKIRYLLRCLPPLLSGGLASQFDELVMQSALHQLDIRPEEQAAHVKYWIRAPLTNGGFGLSSTEEEAPRAYISSLAAIAASSLPSLFTPYCDGSKALDNASNLHEWIDHALHLLKPSSSVPHANVAVLPSSESTPRSPPLPTSPSSLFPFYSKRPSSAINLQSKLTQQATKQQLHHAASELKLQYDSALVKAHINSITAPYAHVWKTVHPTSAMHVLTDAQYRIAARLNLLLPPHHNQMPRDCTSCHKPDAFEKDSWHHLACNSHKRREINARHNAVILALYSHVRYAGGAATIEPPRLSADSRIRPDLQIVFPNQHILTDVVISHPTCPSHIVAASAKQLATAEQAAVTKHTTYDQLAVEQQARFLPFSVETMGGMSKEAVELVEQIGLACRDHLTLATHESIARGVRASVACAIQRGNAMTVLAVYSRAVMQGGRRPVVAA
jgi:hypothetical protein